MSKQEKIVCAATEFKYNFIADAVIPRINYNDNYTNDHQYIMSLHDEDVVCIKKTDGFITNKNRFVDPFEAKKISVYNDNRVDYGIYKEMERLRKELAKASNKRNRGQLGIELTLNVLESKYFELESKLNEFKSRGHLLPEDLY